MFFSDLLQTLLASPYGGVGMMGGPQLPAIAKSPNNATATAIPGAKIPGPYDGLTAMTALANTVGENQLREGQLSLLGPQRALLEQQLGINKQIPGMLDDVMKQLGQPQGGGTGSQAATGGGTRASAGDLPDDTSAASLVKHYESGGDYNKGFGEADLSKAPKDENGFPVWEGHMGPQGLSHAAGAYQFQPATWAQYAKPLGIKDFSPASQDAVFRAAYLDKGFGHWAPYNARLAAAIARLPQGVPSSPAGTGGDASNTVPGVPNFTGQLTGNEAMPYAPEAPPAMSGGGQAPAVAASAGFDPNVWSAKNGRGIGQDEKGNLVPYTQVRDQRGRLRDGSDFDYNAPGFSYGNAPAPAEQFAAGAAQPTGAGTNGIVPPNVPQGAPAQSPGDIFRSQVGLPPAAAAAAPPTVGLPNIPAQPGMSPLQAAIVKLGVISRLGKLGDVATPLEQAFYNSPQMKAQVAAAEAWAKVHPELFSKWNSPINARANGGVMNPATGELTGAMPTIQQITDPVTGQKSFAYITPPVRGQTAPTVVPTGAVSALGPGQTTEAETVGRNKGNLGTLLPGSEGAVPESHNTPTVSPYGIIPPLAEQKMPQSAKEIEDAIPAWQSRVVDWTKGIDSARQAEQRLMTIAQAFKATESGSWATEKASLSAALKSVGVNLPDNILNDPTAVQLALHENILTTLPLLKAATPRPSQVEFVTTSENREHPNIQPAANLQMLAEDIAMMRQAQNLPAAYNASGWRNPLSFETAYYGRNKLAPLVDQVQKEIGPLKGMGEAIPAGARQVGFYQGKPVYDVPQPGGGVTRQVLH